MVAIEPLWSMFWVCISGGANLTHWREIALLLLLVYFTQVAIYLFKVHHTFDTKHPGGVFCGIFACAPEPSMSSCCRLGKACRDIMGRSRRRDTGDWHSAGGWRRGYIQTGWWRLCRRWLLHWGSVGAPSCSSSVSWGRTRAFFSSKQMGGRLSLWQLLVDWRCSAVYWPCCVV